MRNFFFSSLDSMLRFVLIYSCRVQFLWLRYCVELNQVSSECKRRKENIVVSRKKNMVDEEHNGIERERERQTLCCAIVFTFIHLAHDERVCWTPFYYFFFILFIHCCRASLSLFLVFIARLCWWFCCCFCFLFENKQKKKKNKQERKMKKKNVDLIKHRN